MSRYSGANPTVDLVPPIPQSVRIRGASSGESARVSDARPDLPPPATPANGVPLVAWEMPAPDTPSPPVAIISAPVSPRASDDVWGPPQVRDPVSVLPEEFMEPGDPPTDLPGIEGFLDALND